MQITPIVNNDFQNKNTNFEGTMRKSVVKSIRRLENLDRAMIAEDLKRKGQILPRNILNGLKASSEKIVKRLEAFSNGLPQKATLGVHTSNSGFEQLYVTYKNGPLKTSFPASSSRVFVDGRCWVNGSSYLRTLDKSIDHMESPQEVKTMILVNLLEDFGNQIQNLKIKNSKELVKRYNFIKEAFPNEELPKIEIFQKVLKNSIAENERKKQYMRNNAVSSDEILKDFTKIVKEKIQQGLSFFKK